MDNQTINEGKTYALIAYMTLFGTLVAFFMNRDRRNSFTTFHVRQSLGLGLLYVIVGYMIGGFDSWNITGAFWVVFLCLYFYGMFCAINGKSTPIPIIGPMFQNIFKSIGQ